MPNLSVGPSPDEDPIGLTALFIEALRQEFGGVTDDELIAQLEEQLASGDLDAALLRRFCTQSAKQRM